MSGTNSYDVTVVGGGPAGYVTAIRAAQLGLRAALVEKENLGGVCLNRGCIPTKSLLRNAELAYLLRHEANNFGLHFDNLRLDYGAALRRSREVVRPLVGGVGGLMRKHKIDVVKGTAELVAPGTLRVRGEHSLELEARNVIIATGSRARALPGVEFDQERVINSDRAVALEEPPRSLVIIGAGPIGLEFATIFNAYGTEVTIVEMATQIAPQEDTETAAVLEGSLRRAGVTLMLGAAVQGITRTKDGVVVTVSANGTNATVSGDMVLVAVGRAPNSEDLGLERLGVTVERGFIQVDGQMRTNVPGIYAIGDVTGRQLLAHKAMHEGLVAAEAIAGKNPHPVNYTNVPACTYTRPQIASVGLTEEGARAKGYEVQVAKFPFQANGKALGLGEPVGFVKLVVDKQYGEILGAHMVGPEVTELIGQIVQARTAGLTTHELVASMQPHPTLSEALGEAAMGIMGRMIHL